jgi:hypothetical protein
MISGGKLPRSTIGFLVFRERGEDAGDASSSEPTHSGQADLENVITHLRTSLAYLDNYRDAPQSRALRFWPFSGGNSSPPTSKAPTIVLVPESKRLH